MGGVIYLGGFLDNFVAFIQSYGIIGLAVLSFAESSFFPIPPDILLIPMAFMNRHLALLYALVTTVSSVLGGVFGHVIGKKLGKPILIKLFKADKLSKVENYFKKYGGWSIAIAGFTPIPYKIFTISAGVFNVRMFTLIIASIFGRGARFFFEALLIFLLGDTAKYYLQNYFEIFTVAVTILFIMLYLISKKLKATKKIGNTGIIAFIKRKCNELHTFTIKYKNYDEAAIYFFMNIFLSLTSLFIFLDLVEDYLTKENWGFDLIVASYVDSIRNNFLNSFFKVITKTGNVIPMLIITFIVAVIFIRIKKEKQALFISINTLGLWIFNGLLKQIFKRPRPSGSKIIAASGYSFPSGHAMIFMGFSILICYYILLYVKQKRTAIFLSILILAYSILVGLSRVYLGVHYFSDVLAGWFAGILWSSGSIAIYDIFSYKKSLK